MVIVSDDIPEKFSATLAKRADLSQDIEEDHAVFTLPTFLWQQGENYNVKARYAPRYAKLENLFFEVLIQINCTSTNKKLIC